MISTSRVPISSSSSRSFGGAGDLRPRQYHPAGCCIPLPQALEERSARRPPRYLNPTVTVEQRRAGIPNQYGLSFTGSVPSRAGQPRVR